MPTTETMTAMIAGGAQRPAVADARLLALLLLTGP